MHMYTCIYVHINIHKATRSVGPVEWTPYPTDLENAHRDALGKWCKSAHETGHVQQLCCNLLVLVRYHCRGQPPRLRKITYYKSMHICIRIHIGNGVDNIVEECFALSI